MSLRYDYTNLLHSNAIPCAPREEDLAQHETACKAAHHAILSDRKNDVLGFYDLPDQDTSRIKQPLARLHDRFDEMLVLGIGGSALGNRALYTALRTAKGLEPKLHVCDNVDPLMLKAILDDANLDRTLVNVITKSGTTAETMSVFLIVLDIMQQRFPADYQQRVIVTTDAEKGFLRQVVRQGDYTDFLVPDNVGGRFSVLTDVGLVSSAFAGLDIDALLAGAAAMRTRCECDDIWRNPAYLNGLLHYLHMRQGKNISVMMPYANALYDMADWYRQLWAESLGKRHTVDGREVFVGQTPVKALGTTDQHSQVQLYTEGPNDKVHTFLVVEDFGFDYTIPNLFPERDEVNYLGGQPLSHLLNIEALATEMALTRAGRPNCTIIFPTLDEYHLGEMIFLYEVQTVFTGKLLGVNPLDQPGVEAGKVATYGMMGKQGFDEQRREADSYIEQKASRGKVL
ncbi:MAG: glucose-6-phosphate isomerase [Candidatus Cloacimonetes bacterium]|nr:glucose-6-phosphate isomerase [Candidatus Cloacimonadota bacterium]